MLRLNLHFLHGTRSQHARMILTAALSALVLQELVWVSTWHYSRNGETFGLIIGESARNMPSAYPLNFSLRLGIANVLV